MDYETSTKVHQITTKDIYNIAISPNGRVLGFKIGRYHNEQQIFDFYRNNGQVSPNIFLSLGETFVSAYFDNIDCLSIKVVDVQNL